MKKQKGALIGATIGGGAALMVNIAKGPFGLLGLAATLVAIDASARLGAMVAEAFDAESHDFSVAVNVK